MNPLGNLKAYSGHMFRRVNLQNYLSNNKRSLYHILPLWFVQGRDRASPYAVRYLYWLLYPPYYVHPVYCNNCLWMLKLNIYSCSSNAMIYLNLMQCIWWERLVCIKEKVLSYVLRSSSHPMCIQRWQATWRNVYRLSASTTSMCFIRSSHSKQHKPLSSTLQQCNTSCCKRKQHYCIYISLLCA